MKSRSQRIRVAVAEDTMDGTLAPQLGRAQRFALFDIYDRDVRGPLYRVRHDEHSGTCGNHEELTSILRDCQAVISGNAGQRLIGLLRERGIHVALAGESRPSAQLAAAFAAGRLIPSLS